MYPVEVCQFVFMDLSDAVVKNTGTDYFEEFLNSKNNVTNLHVIINQLQKHPRTHLILGEGLFV